MPKHRQRRATPWFIPSLASGMVCAGSAAFLLTGDVKMQARRGRHANARNVAPGSISTVYQAFGLTCYP